MVLAGWPGKGAKTWHRQGGIKFLRMAIFLQREAKIWKTEGLATHVATNEFFPGLPVEALEAQYSL